MRDRYLWWRREDVDLEHRHAVEEGRDVWAMEAEFQALMSPGVSKDGHFQHRVNALMDQVTRLPIRADFPFSEPSSGEGIATERPDGPRRLRLTLGDDQLLDRFHGAWLGRCAGCLLGKPLEGVRTPALWGLLAEAGHDGLSDYLWRMDIPEALFTKHALAERVLPFGRSINCMPEDDDTNYTVSGLAMIKQHGPEFTPSNVADFWLHNLPIMHTFTSERIAYRNFVLGVEPPASASTRNPCREWIGAQIRADFLGYLAAGHPEWAAQMAWRDACISHTRSGIYGEMWVAAMIATAACESDIRQVIEVGLTEVPRRSRFTQGVRDVLDWHGRKLSYRQAIQQVHKRWDEHHWHDWHHTIANAQVVAVALLWSEGDFGRAITGAVYPGFDTDCNGATVGSIMGMMLGARAIPPRWVELMNDTLLTGVTGFHRVHISDLAAQTLDLHRRHRVG